MYCTLLRQLQSTIQIFPDVKKDKQILAQNFYWKYQWMGLYCFLFSYRSHISLKRCWKYFQVKLFLMKTEGCFLKEKMQQNCKCTVIQTSPFSLQFYRNVFLQGKTGDFPDQNYFFKAKSRNRITWMLAIILTRKKKRLLFLQNKARMFFWIFSTGPQGCYSCCTHGKCSIKLSTSRYEKSHMSRDTQHFQIIHGKLASKFWSPIHQSRLPYFTSHFAMAA